MPEPGGLSLRHTRGGKARAPGELSWAHLQKLLSYTTTLLKRCYGGG